MSEKITSKVEQISPNKAKHMLEKNTGNFRRLDQARVTRYAEDMSKGNWLLNGESIKMNGEILLDGQHRLAAIIKSGVTVPMLVIYGISTDAASSLDGGCPRSLASWLSHLNIKHATTVAAVSRMIVQYQKGYWCTTIGSNGSTKAECIKFATENTEAIQSAIRLASPCGKFIPASNIAAMMFIAADGFSGNLAESNETCRWFCEALANGQDLKNNDPVYRLREALNIKSAQHRPRPVMQKVLATVAWNKTARGETCQALTVRLTGPRKMSLPDKIEPAPKNDE